jgi:hypothetical protein
VTLYTWEVLPKCTPEQIDGVYLGIYDQSDVAHASAMWSRCAASVDFLGIFQKSSIAAEEAYRQNFCRAIRFRFLKACQWTWQYRRVNVNPAQEREYKNIAFGNWRKLVTNNDEYQAIMGDDTNVDVVRTNRETDQAQHRVGLFRLSKS